ncbi:YbjN domain-containing protein [Cutibacterium sp.]|uniref:T3SS (YopN, CesT) and YbjN peptide-binding chaperone 1 n=1 Tax=Cutibacterium sp. TaxID=1912221 RepID=UPI0026DB0A24|nr:YbjN domain-containing protein [Cutibacterium sp.]MDO4411842.1 hypothetical protein [Cutibacterium sp.]
MEEQPDFAFDPDRSTAQAWGQFTERLAEVVSVIDDDGELTISTLSAHNDPTPFIRFVQDDPGLSNDTAMILAEASSNSCLPDRSQLTSGQLDGLRALGWQAPGTCVSHKTENYWVYRSQEDSEQLAELAVATLRDIFGVPHPVFLAPDQLAEILQPEPPLSPTETASVPAIMPVDKDHLDRLVADELSQMFGYPAIRDSEGDFAIRVGTSMVFVRTTPDASELLLFAVLVHDIEGRSRAVEVLNDLNVQSRYGRFALHQDRVFVTMSVMARPFVAAHLHQAVSIMSRLADGLDNELARKLRGRTTFEDGS